MAAKGVQVSNCWHYAANCWHFIKTDWKDMNGQAFRRSWYTMLVIRFKNMSHRAHWPIKCYLNAGSHISVKIMAKTANTGLHNKPIRSGSLFEMFALIGESSHISSVSWTATSSAIVQLYIHKYRSIYVHIRVICDAMAAKSIQTTRVRMANALTWTHSDIQTLGRTEWLNFTSYFMQAINMHFTLCTFLHLFLNVFLPLSISVASPLPPSKVSNSPFVFLWAGKNKQQMSWPDALS